MIKRWRIWVVAHVGSYYGPFFPLFTSTLFCVIPAVLRTPDIPRGVIPASYSSYFSQLFQLGIVAAS